MAKRHYNNNSNNNYDINNDINNDHDIDDQHDETSPLREQHCDKNNNNNNNNNNDNIIDTDDNNFHRRMWGGGSVTNKTAAVAVVVCISLAVAVVALLVAVMEFFQIQSLAHQVNHNKEHLDELENTIQNQQAQEIHTISQKVDREHSLTIYQMAGTFTLLASLITMFHMTNHLTHFNEPIVQRKILAILWMSPIYGVTSFLGLVLPSVEGYLSILKDFYESYVIYQFLAFLICVLGRGDRNVVVKVLAEAASRHHSHKHNSHDNHHPQQQYHHHHHHQDITQYHDYENDNGYENDDNNNNNNNNQDQVRGIETNATTSSSAAATAATLYAIDENYNNVNDDIDDDDYENVNMDNLRNYGNNNDDDDDYDDDDDDDNYHDSNNMAWASATLHNCQVAAMQFVFIRPITSIANFVLDAIADHHHYNNNNDNHDNNNDESQLAAMLSFIVSPRFVVLVVENISVFIAFRGLLNFYHAVRDDLAWCRPFSKFLCIKGVVFMTFWQGLLISLMANLEESNNDGSGSGWDSNGGSTGAGGGTVHRNVTATGTLLMTAISNTTTTSSTSTATGGGGGGGGGDIGDASFSSLGAGHEEEQETTWNATSIQNVLICLEMLLFSLAHWCAFPTEEWQEGYQQQQQRQRRRRPRPGLGLKDFVSDVNSIVEHHTIQRRSKKNQMTLIPTSTSTSSTTALTTTSTTTALETETVNNDENGNVDAQASEKKILPKIS